MKKRLLTMGMTIVMAAGMATTAFAAGWQHNTNGWWYDNGNGTWPANTWQWIDGNNDGVAESYYFDGNGYLLTNTTTPDGYTVNADGAWIENGVVQVQQAAVNNVVKGQYDGKFAMTSWDGMSSSYVTVETVSDTVLKLKYEDGTEQIFTYSESETQYYEAPTYTYEPDENSDDIPWRITFNSKDQFFDKAANFYDRVQ